MPRLHTSRHVADMPPALAPALPPASIASARSPAAATREALLDSGFALAARVGLRGLTVRGVTSRTGANPGSFVYHFGSRDAFQRELLERWYQPLCADLSQQLDNAEAALPRLRSMLLHVTGFVNRNGGFISQLLMDALAGEAVAREFLAGLSPRHFVLLLDAVRKAQQAGAVCDADPLHILSMLVAASGAPLMLHYLIAGQPAVPQLMQESLMRFGADPAAIAQRIDWALKGVSTTAAATATAADCTPKNTKKRKSAI